MDDKLVNKEKIDKKANVNEKKQKKSVSGNPSKTKVS